MSWFDNLMPSRIKTRKKNQQIPDGVWRKCPGCQEVLYVPDLEYNQYVCPKCGYHMRIDARRRLTLLFDQDSETTEIGADLRSNDFLKFKDSKRYRDRLAQAAKSSSEKEALIAMSGKLHGRDLTAAACEFSYMGGSMGSVVGERFVRAVEHALEQHTAFVCFSASGGARMQEGLTSLMQMAKTSAALARLSAAKLPFISVLSDPTMGGVSASFAMLGDIIIAEPGALIGFAGPRVIEQTVRETLPEGFQRSEFLLQKGAIDMIVDRRKMRDELADLLALLLQEQRPEREPAETEASPPGARLEAPEHVALTEHSDTLTPAQEQSQQAPGEAELLPPVTLLEPSERDPQTDSSDTVSATPTDDRDQAAVNITAAEDTIKK